MVVAYIASIFAVMHRRTKENGSMAVMMILGGSAAM